MGLTTWDKLPDLYDYVQFSGNWTKVDQHDHSPGHGPQIGAAGIAPGAVGLNQLASAVPTMPIGAVIIWPVTSVPSGYLACDGSQQLIASYPALYAVLGSGSNPWNNSPASGYFSLPLLDFGITTTAQFVIKN